MLSGFLFLFTEKTLSEKKLDKNTAKLTLHLANGTIKQVYVSPNETFLDLSSKNIVRVEGLEQLKHLNGLWLKRNKIEKIQGIDKLYKLQTLSLDYNKITINT